MPPLPLEPTYSNFYSMNAADEGSYSPTEPKKMAGEAIMKKPQKDVEGQKTSSSLRKKTASDTTDSVSSSSASASNDNEDAREPLSSTTTQGDGGAPPKKSPPASKPPPRRRTQSEPARVVGILKKSNEEIPISSKATWLNLPKPDVAALKRCDSAPEISTAARRRRSSVAFDTITIREYDQVLGDNPSVSYGPPIALDWNYSEREPVGLDDYEYNRQNPRRTLRQMLMNYYTRKNVLMWSFGYTEEEINQATKQVEKAKRGRAVTKYFLPVAKVEDFVSSAGRKAKRAVGGKSRSKSA